MDPTSTWARERYAFSRFVNLPIGARERDAYKGWEHRVDAQRSRPEDHIVADFQRALRLRGPGISQSNCFFGIACAYCVAGRWDDARRWFRKALAENPRGAWIHRNLSALAFVTGDRAGVAQSVDTMRRAHPYLTVSYLAENYPVADRRWLEALANADMPLS